MNNRIYAINIPDINDVTNVVPLLKQIPSTVTVYSDKMIDNVCFKISPKSTTTNNPSTTLLPSYIKADCGNGKGIIECSLKHIETEINTATDEQKIKLLDIKDFLNKLMKNKNPKSKLGSDIMNLVKQAYDKKIDNVNLTIIFS